MIRIQEVDTSFLEEYDKIPMQFEVKTEFRLQRLEQGLGGFLFEETPVVSYIKDFRKYECAAEYGKHFDISGWRFYAAFDAEKPIGAITVAGRASDLDMLPEQCNACVLWDIRVEDAYKHMGIGQRLLDAGIAGARADGYTQMVIECQNNNVPACRFYKKQGAQLIKVDTCAYLSDPEIAHEIQLVWLLDI